MKDNTTLKYNKYIIQTQYFLSKKVKTKCIAGPCFKQGTHGKTKGRYLLSVNQVSPVFSESKKRKQK